MRPGWRSYAFVTVQFLCLGLIALSGPLLPARALPLLLLFGGLLLGVWAVLSMRLASVSVLPDVRAAATLTTTGPYRLIRHPMYTSVLLVALGLVLGAPGWGRAALWLVLLADLVLKLRYEERLLAARFADYGAYRRRTWRMLPFVY